jgi:integral membrane protein (TIGR01906 family)
VRFLTALFRVLFILSLPAFFLSLSLALAFNNLRLYEYSFEHYDVSEVTGISEPDLNRSARELISYFNNKEEFARISVVQSGEQTQLLTTDEQLHFRDVKGLVWLDYKVLLASFLVGLAFVLWSVFSRSGGRRRALAKAAIWGGGLTLFILVAVIIGSFFDFNSLFLKFHELAFNNNYWYAPGNMTLLFPESFWETAAIICFAFSALLAILTTAVSLLALRKTLR